MRAIDVAMKAMSPALKALDADSRFNTRSENQPGDGWLPVIVRRTMVTKRRRQGISVDLGEAKLPEWVNLGDKAATFVASISQIPGAEAGLSLIKALLGVEDAQSRLLKAMSDNIELVRRGPFRAATEQVAIAARSKFRSAGYTRHLQLAEDHLVTALGLSNSVQEHALVNYQLGLVLLLEGQRDESLHRLETSYEECRAVVRSLMADIDAVAPKSLGEMMTSAVAISMNPSFGDSKRRIQEIWTAEKAIRALRPFVPFANSVVASLNAASAQRHPFLVGREGKRGGFSATWTGPTDPETGR